MLFFHDHTTALCFLQPLGEGERHHQLKLLVVIINVIINSLWYMSIPVKIFIFWSWTCLRVFLFFQLS